MRKTMLAQENAGLVADDFFEMLHPVSCLRFMAIYKYIRSVSMGPRLFSHGYSCHFSAFTTIEKMAICERFVNFLLNILKVGSVLEAFSLCSGFASGSQGFGHHPTSRMGRFAPLIRPTGWTALKDRGLDIQSICSLCYCSRFISITSPADHFVLWLATTTAPSRGS